MPESNSFLDPPTTHATLRSPLPSGNLDLLGSGFPREPQLNVPPLFSIAWPLGELCEWPWAVTLAPHPRGSPAQGEDRDPTGTPSRAQTTSRELSTSVNTRAKLPSPWDTIVDAF